MYPVLLVALIALLSGPAVASALNATGRLAHVSQPASQAQDVTTVSVPVETSDASRLTIAADSAYAVDIDSGAVLYQKDADKRRAIASITKLATAITIVHNHSMTERVTIPTLPAYKPEDETVGLQPGEKYEIKDLLTALLVNSANDAGDALAIIDSGSIADFSDKMNKLMGEWQITDARFSNPTGLADTGNEASAKAVAQMGMLALRNDDLRRLFNTQFTSIRSQSGRAIVLNTTNELLPQGRFSGIKTGYTLAAGQCFVGLTQIKGHQVVTVVLRSNDRFGDTRLLADWINRSYIWR